MVFWRKNLFVFLLKFFRFSNRIFLIILSFQVMAESVSCDLDAAQVTPEVKTELDPEEESHE